MKTCIYLTLDRFINRLQELTARPVENVVAVSGAYAIEAYQGGNEPNFLLAQFETMHYIYVYQAQMDPMQARQDLVAQGQQITGAVEANGLTLVIAESILSK